MPSPSVPAVAYASADAPAGERTRTLYERLGAVEGFANLVDRLMARIHGDPRVMGNEAVKKRTEAIHAPTHRELWVEHFCALTGGPCCYVGRDIKMAHAGLGISGTEWDAAMEDLVAVLDEMKIGEAEKTELVELMTGFRESVVENP